GTALSTSLLNWASSGLTGPFDPKNGDLLVPSVGSVQVALPDPTAPAGTPTTVFRSWAFAAKGALEPETSIDGGLTFSLVASAGISSTAQGTLFPPLVVDPVKVLESGKYKDMLLFGTDT